MCWEIGKKIEKPKQEDEKKTITECNTFSQWVL